VWETGVINVQTWGALDNGLNYTGNMIRSQYTYKVIHYLTTKFHKQHPECTCSHLDVIKGNGWAHHAMEHGLETRFVLRLLSDKFWTGHSPLPFGRWNGQEAGNFARFTVYNYSTTSCWVCSLGILCVGVDVLWELGFPSSMISLGCLYWGHP
jgi:hypothetical protein